MAAEFKLGKPLVVEIDTERIWLTGEFYTREQAIEGIRPLGPRAPAHAAVSIFGDFYYLNRLTYPNGTPVSDEGWVECCQKNPNYLKPTHVLFADSLPYAYLLLLVPPQGDDKTKAMASYYCKITGCDPLRAIAAKTSIKPIVFKRLSKEGGTRQFESLYTAPFDVRNQDGSIVVSRGKW